MTSAIEIFTQNKQNFPLDKIISKIKKGEWIDICQSFCSTNNNELIFDYIFFKCFAAPQTYNILFNFIIQKIDDILLKYDSFMIHVNIKSLTVMEADKHKSFIQDVTTFLYNKYPDKMKKCFVYNSPFGFSQILKIASVFLVKETLDKIEVVSKNKEL